MPRLLDLFCGAGGAAAGYAKAGFEVVGVDIHPQPHFPFEFIQADAMTYPLDGFDLIHASPPCQGYSAMNTVHKRQYPMLIAPIRERLIESGIPYVIENVEGARDHMKDPVRLCGTMFGLGVIRHRLFEASFQLPRAVCGVHRSGMYSPAGHGDPNWRNRERNPHLSGRGYTQRCREAMGISWMNRDELAESIPPAYTRWIASAFLWEVKGEWVK